MSGTNKYVAIGDVHGCAASLEKMLEKLDSSFGSNPIYVFLGDYPDRGPDSKRVVDLLIEFKKNHGCIFIRGNHDQMLLDAYQRDEWSLWLHNGGWSTLESYGLDPHNFDLPEDHVEFYRSTELWWETSNYFFVHAGMNPKKTIQENLDSDHEVEQFMWQRKHIHSRKNKWDKTVVFGHTPARTPITKQNMLGIDTGCVYQRDGMGILTAVSLPEMDFITQSCIDF